MPAKHAQQTDEIRVDGDSPVEFRICPSRTGFYVGTYCDGRGPLSRESEHYANRRDVERDLRNQTVRWRR